MSSGDVLDLLAKLGQSDADQLSQQCDQLVSLLGKAVPEGHDIGYETETSNPAFLPTLLEVLHTTMQSAKDDSIIPIIKVAAFISYRKGICGSFTSSQCQSLARTVCELALTTTNLKLCNFCTWYVAMQRFSPAQLGEVSRLLMDVALHACSGVFPSVGVRSEGLKAVARLLEQMPAPVILSWSLGTSSTGGKTRGWIHAIYSSLVSQSESVRAQAQSLTERGLKLIGQLDSSARHNLSVQVVDDLMAENGILHSLQLMVRESGKWGKDKEATVHAAVIAWGFMARVLGGKLVKDGHINAFLKIMEAAFVYKAHSVRTEAYRSWIALAVLFDSMNSTVAHPKRLALVLSPLTTALRSEENAAVRVTAFAAWCHVAKMLAKGSQLERTFDAVFASVLPLVFRDSDPGIRGDALRVLSYMFGGTQTRQESSGHWMPASMFPGGLRAAFLQKHVMFFLDLLAEPALYSAQTARSDIASAWSAVVAWLAAEHAGGAREEGSAALLEAAVKRMCSCVRATEGDDGHAAWSAEVVATCTANEDIAKLLVSVSTSLDSAKAGGLGSPGAEGEHKVKLAPLLAGAVASARGRDAGLGAFRRLVQLCANAGQPRLLQQVFEALLHYGPDAAAADLLPFWTEAAAALGKLTEDFTRRASMATPNRSKAAAAALSTVLVKICNLRMASGLPASAEPVAGLDREWLSLLAAFQALVSQRDEGSQLVAAARICELLQDRGPEAFGESQVQYAAFVLGAVLKEDALEEPLAYSKAPLARYSRRNQWERWVASIGKLWARWTSAGLQGVLAERCRVGKVKELVALLCGVLDGVSTGAELRALVAVVAEPLQRLFQACSKERKKCAGGEEGEGAGSTPGSSLANPLKLYHHGAQGLADETEAVWERACQAVTRCFAPSHADAALLEALAPLFCDAFASPNLVIKNKAVAAWNASLGKATVALPYPERLSAALRKLAKTASIALPSAQRELLQSAPHRSPSPERSTQDCSQTLDGSRTHLHRSPARIAAFAQPARGSLLPGAAPHGTPRSRPGSQHNTPAASPARPSPRTAGAAGGGGYVRVTPSKRRLVLTAHQKEARRAQQQSAVVAYTGLEDAESQLQMPEEYADLVRGDSTTFPASPDASLVEAPAAAASEKARGEAASPLTPRGASEATSATPVTVGVQGGKHKRALEDAGGEGAKAEEFFARLGKEARKGLGLV